jgi:hypothetical protein
VPSSGGSPWDGSSGGPNAPGLPVRRQGPFPGHAARAKARALPCRIDGAALDETVEAAPTGVFAVPLEGIAMPEPRPAPRSAADALDLLSEDQDQVLDLFDRYDALALDQATADRRRRLADEICTLLLVQIEIEREILFPAARAALADETPIDEATESLAGIEATIVEIQSGDPGEPRYDATMRILQELFVECMEEQRVVLFPNLRETSIDLEELGGELSAREEVLLEVDDDPKEL